MLDTCSPRRTHSESRLLRSRRSQTGLHGERQGFFQRKTRGGSAGHFGPPQRQRRQNVASRRASEKKWILSAQHLPVLRRRPGGPLRREDHLPLAGEEGGRRKRRSGPAAGQVRRPEEDTTPGRDQG